jgi:hypothetical protein
MSSRDKCAGRLGRSACGLSLGVLTVWRCEFATWLAVKRPSLVRTTIATGRAIPSVALQVLFDAAGSGPGSAAKARDDVLNVVQRTSKTSAAAAVNKLAGSPVGRQRSTGQPVRKDQDLAAEFGMVVGGKSRV